MTNDEGMTNDKFVATPLWGVCIFEAARSERSGRALSWLQRVRIFEDALVANDDIIRGQKEEDGRRNSKRRTFNVQRLTPKSEKVKRTV